MIILLSFGNQGLSKAEIEKRVRPLLELVQLESRANYYPSQLSGGQSNV